MGKIIKNRMVFNETICMETQTVFNENGNITIHPCDFELGQQIVHGGNQADQRGRMVTDDNGTSHFRPYRDGTGRRYTELRPTASGGLLGTKKSVIVDLKFKKKLSKMDLLEQFDREVGQIRDYILSRDENIMWDDKVKGYRL